MKLVLILIIAFFIGFNLQVSSKVHEISSFSSLEAVVTAIMAITNFVIGGIFVKFLLKR